MSCPKFVFMCLHEHKHISMCVYVCVRLCLFARKPLRLSVASFWDWPDSYSSIEVLIQIVFVNVCVCVRVCLAPLVFSLIPVSGKHQPLKTQTAGFFPPRSPPRTKFGEQLGRP